MRFLQKIKDEKGSITMTVVAAMLFITAAILIAYFSLSNQSNDQSKKIRQIEDSYKVTNSDLVQKYKETYDKSPDHTEVSYIQSTGTQYIDTEIKANDINKIFIKFNIVENTGAHQGILGGGYTTNNKSFQVLLNASNNLISSRFGTNVLTIPYDDSVHGIDLSKEKIRIDNIESSSITSIDDSRTIYLFARRADELGSGIQQFSKCRIYNCKIWDNNTLARDFVPALDRKGIPCLYDTIEGKHYYNQGEGEFLYGNE